MLIRNAEVWGHGLADVRIESGRIAAILPPGISADGLDAHGAALFAGLHDHHLHLAGLAVRAQSVWCGPPEIDDAAALTQRLVAHPGTGWIRGIGYHESVIGLPGAAALDRLVPNRPLRIQHRSGRMWLLNSLGLAVCVQPAFVVERGDAYRRDVEPRHQDDLYRLASLAEAGIAMAGGSDAPFCSADPWLGMRAAVDRRTASGQPFGNAESLTPETALALYLADPLDLACQRQIVPTAPADLVLLDRCWAEARERLSSADVRLTMLGGEIIHDRVD